MVTRRHGVIGGPRTKKSVSPRATTGVKPPKPYPPVVIVKAEEEEKVFVISPSEDKENPLEREILTESPVEEITNIIAEVDPVEEEDKVTEHIPTESELLKKDPKACPYCDFVGRSKKGLKTHIRWKHSTEAFEQE